MCILARDFSFFFCFCFVVVGYSIANFPVGIRCKHFVASGIEVYILCRISLILDCASGVET